MLLTTSNKRYIICINYFKGGKEMDKQEIINYAKRLLEKYTISTFSNDIAILELLNKIVNEKNVETVNEAILKSIEEYLDNKTEEQNINSDREFLSELADNLELQKIRKSDYNDFKVIVFKIKDIDNNEYIFLTRKYLNKYVQLHKKIFNNPTIMELEFKNNPELNKLLDIIKRNFKTMKRLD